MGPTLHILSCPSSADSDQAFRKFGSFLGLQTEIVALNKNGDSPLALLTAAADERVLALEWSLLLLLSRHDWFARLLDEARFVLVYSCAATDGESPELKWLTAGAVASVGTIDGGQKQFTVHADVAFGDFPVSGKSFAQDSGSMAAFPQVTPESGIETYITADRHPLFLSALRGRSRLFLLAGPPLVDLDTVLAPEASLRPWYVPLVATAIFLRSAFGPWCWTSPLTAATFIVDDLSLQRRHGFFNYETVVGELEKASGALTVAFIPYNHRRSDPRTVDLVSRHLDRFSIAVHGCDHTGGEFASLDEQWLDGTIACSLARMEAHAGRTQMPFDNVMVFPQGCFSTKAIRALKSSSLSAAVNTTPWPRDCEGDPLTVRDLLDVAVTHYAKFPIFTRRYPGDVFDFAFDALFQKPVLVVEHHAYFRHGCAPLAAVFREISAFTPKPSWMPLGRNVTSSCVLRKTGDNNFALRHFTSEFRHKNSTPGDLALSLEKPEADGVVEAVLVGDHKVPFELNSGFLRYEALLGPGEDLHVEVLYRPTRHIKRKTSLKYRISTFTRRLLSDMGDNQFSRSERLLSAVEKVKQTIVHRRNSAGHSL